MAKIFLGTAVFCASCVQPNGEAVGRVSAEHQRAGALNRRYGAGGASKYYLPGSTQGDGKAVALLVDLGWVEHGFVVHLPQLDCLVCR